MNNKKSKPVKRKFLESDDSSDDETCFRKFTRSSDDDVSDGSTEEEEESSSSSSSSTESETSLICLSSTTTSSSSSSAGPSTSASTSGTSNGDEKAKKSSDTPKNKTPVVESSSESADENCEKCSICLRAITTQEVGNPEGCDHMFCSVCIIEWSKNSNVCPLDRQQFSIILVRDNKTGTVVRKVPIEEENQEEGGERLWSMIQADYVDDTVCEICGRGDREDIMLLCDLCDRGFHTVCLTPPMETIPDENEWYCADCTLLNPTDEANREMHSARTLRPRFSMVRTRLLERIRVTVNRIVENYVLRQAESALTRAIQSDFDSDADVSSATDIDMIDINQPSTSTGRNGRSSRPTTNGRRAARPRKRSARRTTSNGRRKAKKRSSTTTTTTTTSTSRKRKSTANGRRKTKGRRTKVKTTRMKKIKVENEDGTVTEKIVKTRTYKRRKQKTRKRKPKTTSNGIRRGLRVKSKTTPKTVKGRLTLKLKMMPPNKPGQLLPDIKVKPPNSHLSSIDLNRARAGIPKLHIFAPRDELQYYSSESDNEGFAESGPGGVATATQTRTATSRIQNVKNAALLLQSRATTTTAAKPTPVIESPSTESVDILDSILNSQAIWHSKNTNVKIHDDGSVEVIKDDKKEGSDGSKPKNSNKTADGREKITQAPMHPGSGSRPGGFRPNNRNNYGDSRSGQDNMFGPRSGPSQAGTSFNRFGGPARNDREGYANYLNNMPQGPTPFCRGGPPLRFRMPPRQQLRRIPFPPRNRPAWNPGEESDEGTSMDNDKEEKKGEEEDEEGENERRKDKAESKHQEEDEDIDLYSDIETSMDKTDNSGAEDNATTTTTTTAYPALGPPPEPSPFLLGLNESEDFETDSKTKGEVYDPAEPCDSDEEMVIDENREPEKTESLSAPAKTETDADADNVPKATSQKVSSEDDDEEDCPIFSIYSSATRAFSEKEEEERQREIAEDRRRLEEAKKQEEEKSKPDSESPTDEKEPDEKLKLEMTKEEEEPIEENAEREDKQKEVIQTQRLSFQIDDDVDTKSDDKSTSRDDGSGSPELTKEKSRSRSISPAEVKDEDKRSPSVDSDKERISKRQSSREKSSSTDRTSEKFKRSGRKKKYDSDSGADAAKSDHDRKSDDDDKENDETGDGVVRAMVDDKTPEKDLGSEDEVVLSPQKVAAGLEGLDVEEVSSDNEGDEFADKRSLSSLSLSELSNKSKRSADSDQSKRRKKNRKRKTGKSRSDKNREDDERRDRLNQSKNENDEIGNENSLKAGEKRKGSRRKSTSEGLERQVLGSKENKKSTDRSRDKDLSWKKPSKKDKNYREGKKKSKERGRSKSNERKRSRSPTPKKDKKKNKERKKKTDKKKDMERYDVRKIVKNKEVRKTDAFGRDIVSKSRSITRSRSRSVVRDRSRNMLRRNSRSFSRSRSRSFRRGRSPVRRRYVRSRSRSRSKSATRRSYSRSRSRSRSRKTKKKPKSKDRLKARSRSRGRKSRSCSRGARRRSPTRSRSRSPGQRVVRSKKTRSRRRSWSHHKSRTPSFSPRRSRSITRSPIRVRRTYSRSVSRSWSRGRSSLPRASSLEKLTVILTTKDKKKWKKKKDGKKTRKEEKKKKKSGNSKEIFASGDNVLVSVNFRNNNSSNGNDGSSLTNNDRNTRMNSLSPAPALETSRKRKKGSDYETEKVTKKSKKSSAVSKNVVDVALSNSSTKRAKKLTRLSEKDAEVILNRKPVAVIDLDMSPYREQTPSPVNVVVVSDSGSGDEGKERSPQRPNVRETPTIEAEKVEENVGGPSVDASTTNSPIENGYVPTLGPKTPPEPQIKFSIAKPQQLRPIANPLGNDDDDEEEEEEEAEEEDDGGDDESGGVVVEERLESLDTRIEKELNQRSDVTHKGPNTPPTPRGPSTPKSPPSPQTSPDAYDPFEPTKSRSPTPSQDDKENHPTSKPDAKEEETSESVPGEGLTAVVSNSMTEDSNKTMDTVSESQESKAESSDKGEPGPAVECSSSNVVAPTQGTSAPVSDSSPKESPERKTTSAGASTPQSKSQAPAVQKTFSPVSKQVPIVSSSSTVPPTSAVSTDMFALSSPTKTRTSTSTSTTTATTQTLQVSGIQRLQHRLGSPVNRTPNSVKSTPEKRTTPRPESNNEIFSSGNYMIRNVSKRNGEQPKQTRPLQDATNETIDMTVDMDDSPYSPASSEGDDLFDPPPEVSKPSQSNSKATPSHKASKAHHKSPTKQLSKFDLLFGSSGPALSPLKAGTKKSTNTKLPGKPPALPKLVPPKAQKKGSSKRNVNKMDEDQLRILDELPSSAVELQVKDKFLKKLNRQERVVDEVKTVLKPHYARKHITKEEYKDILRRSVPKICHSRSGEINPSKIQSLIEAYVRKFRHAKKKGMNAVPKPTKVKKTMFS